MNRASLSWANEPASPPVYKIHHEVEGWTIYSVVTRGETKFLNWVGVMPSEQSAIDLVARLELLK